FGQGRLARRSDQLDVLDAFCGEAQLRRRAELRLTWRELTAARRRFQELHAGAAAAEARLAELRALVEDTSGFGPGAEEELRAERERLRHVAELAEGGSAAAAAPRFAEAVAAELAGIGMGEGEFVPELRERESGPTGSDEVAFLARPNRGLPLAPVAETASGGELSRIALAIAAVSGGETIVFDEIDAGIGGETAHRV